MLEDRSENLREAANTFQKTSRAVASVQKRKNSRLMSLSCVIFVVLLLVASFPLILFYWDDIIAFFEGALPPHHNASDAGSGPVEDAPSGDEHDALAQTLGDPRSRSEMVL